MKSSTPKIVVAVILILTAFATFQMAGGNNNGWAQITGEQLVNKINAGEKMIIVDVREPELYAQGHVPGSILMPYEQARQLLTNQLKPDDNIVFVCHTGRMGDELAEYLKEKGYKKLANVTGGMAQYRGPLETGAAPVIGIQR